MSKVQLEQNVSAERHYPEGRENTNQPNKIPARDANVARIVIHYEKDPGSHTFPGSFNLILKAILRDQGADVASLYEYTDVGVLVAREAVGLPSQPLEVASLQLSEAASQWLQNASSIAVIDVATTDYRVGDFPEVLLHRFKTIVVAPLRHGNIFRGVITIGWRETSNQKDVASTRSLTPLVDCAASLLVRGKQASASLRLLTEIANTEASLVDLKITERAQGVVNGSQWTEQAPFMLHEHISRVLESADINRNLREQLDTLQSRLRDRQLLTNAKLLVQRAFGVDEESSYLYLRNQSRRTRRPLREVAREVLTSNFTTGQSDQREPAGDT